MASEMRRDTAPLADVLFDEATSFEFFQAVRLLHLLHTDRAPVGRDGDPGDEAVRFRSHVSFGYPAGDIEGLTPSPDGDGPPEMTVSFMGLATPWSFGSLPACYAEQIAEELHQKNPALRDFLDLFNHRLLSLFYRAWEKSRFAILSEEVLYSLVGLGTPHLSRGLPFDPRATLSRGGGLTQVPVPPQILENLIESYFQVKAEVIPFVPSYSTIEEGETTHLGESHSTLGHDVLLGDRVQTPQQKFRVRLGPLSWAEYQEFLPPGEGCRPLVGWIRLAVGAEFDFDIQLVLRARDVPRMLLTSLPEKSPRLGWSSWLRSKMLPEDPADAIFQSDTREPRNSEKTTATEA